MGRAHPSRAPSMELRWPVDEQIFHLRCVCARPPVEEVAVLLRAWAQRVTDDPAAQRQDGVEKWAFVPRFGGALYILSTKAVPVARPLEYYITLNKRLRYIPYCADFGPFNLGTTTMWAPY